MALMQAPTFGSPLRPHDDAISQVAHLESKPIDLESRKRSLLRTDLSGDQSQQLEEQEPKLGNSATEEEYIRKVKKRKSRLINIKSRNDILEIKIPDLQSSVHDFKSQARDLKAEILDLKAEVFDLRSMVPNHRSQVRNLKAVVLDLKSQVNDLKFEDPSLKVVEYDLKTQVHDLKVEFLNLKSQVPDLKAEYLNLKPQILDLISPGFNITMCCLPLEFLIMRPQMLWFQRFYKGM